MAEYIISESDTQKTKDILEIFDPNVICQYGDISPDDIRRVGRKISCAVNDKNPLTRVNFYNPSTMAMDNSCKVEDKLDHIDKVNNEVVVRVFATDISKMEAIESALNKHHKEKCGHLTFNESPQYVGEN